MAGFLSPFDREQTFDSQLEKVHSLFRRQLAVPLYGKKLARQEPALRGCKCFRVRHVIRPVPGSRGADVAVILTVPGQCLCGRGPWQKRLLTR